MQALQRQFDIDLTQDVSMQGRFIVIEGLEGAGKSTAIHTIQKLLNKTAIEYVVTREPGGTQVGEAIRAIVKSDVEILDSRAELLLFYAARVQLIERVIRPALAHGKWVIADRFELSSWAYQGGGRKLDKTILKSLSDFCVKDLKPDLTIFLDISPEEGLLRAQKRGQLDRIEQEQLSFFRDVAAEYHRILATRNQVVCVDASLPLSVVRRNVRQAVELLI